MQTFILIIDWEVQREARLFRSEKTLTPSEAARALRLDPAWMEDDVMLQVGRVDSLALVPVPDREREVLRTVPGVASFVAVNEPRNHIAIWQLPTGAFDYRVLQSERDLRRDDFLRAGIEIPANASILVEPRIAEIEPIPSLAKLPIIDITPPRSRSP